ncbi:MAG: TraK family protein [Bacteroidota bacterium]
MSTFLEELAKWATGARQTTCPRRKETLAAFLAVRADVKEAIAAGYALKTIWEHMKETGRVSFRYETFLRHVRRHITNAPPERPKQPAPMISEVQAKGGDESKPKALTEPKKSGVLSVGCFNFDPTPNKEELL